MRVLNSLGVSFLIYEIKIIISSIAEVVAMGREGRDLIKIIVTLNTGSGLKLSFCLLSPASPPFLSGTVCSAGCAGRGCAGQEEKVR